MPEGTFKPGRLFAHQVGTYLNGELKDIGRRASQRAIEQRDLANDGFDVNLANIHRYPATELDKTHGWVRFKMWHEVESATDREELKSTTTPTGDSVWLYMPPEGIQVKDGADYSQAELGLFGELVAEGNRSQVKPLKILDEATRSITDAAQVLTKPQNVEMAVITKVLQQAKGLGFGPQGGIGGGARARIKRTANPYLRAIFNQVNRRTFQYSFEMVPNNPRDARAIKNIVQFFREHLYPETEGLSRDDTDLFSDFVYKFPNKWTIGYYFNGKAIGHKINYCYLTDVSVQWGSQSSQTFHPDGEFIATKIDLTFQEEKALTKNDIRRTDEDGLGF